MKNRIGYVLTLLLGIVALPVFLKSCLHDEVVRTGFPTRLDYTFNEELIPMNQVATTRYTDSINAFGVKKFKHESTDRNTQFSIATTFLRRGATHHE